VLVPGLPLDALRCTPQDVRERWGLRRLYVEGNSYYWCYALDAARMALNEAGSDE
jgi:hypothetical protein